MQLNPYVLPGVKSGYYTFLYQPMDVIEIICGYFNLTYKQVNVKSRKKELVLARQYCMLFLMDLNKLSASESALYFKRDHATAIHSKKTIARLFQTYLSTKIEIDEIMELLNYDLLHRDRLKSKLRKY